MHGRHLKKRGNWWHYYRNRSKRYRDVEPRSVITFALKTTCMSEAKMKAAQISRDLEKKWEDSLFRSQSLSIQSDVQQYARAIAANRAHGFQPTSSSKMSDADLLNRLRF